MVTYATHHGIILINGNKSIYFLHKKSHEITILKKNENSFIPYLSNKVSNKTV